MFYKYQNPFKIILHQKKIHGLLNNLEESETLTEKLNIHRYLFEQYTPLTLAHFDHLFDATWLLSQPLFSVIYEIKAFKIFAYMEMGYNPIHNESRSRSSVFDNTILELGLSDYGQPFGNLFNLVERELVERQFQIDLIQFDKFVTSKDWLLHIFEIQKDLIPLLYKKIDQDPQKDLLHFNDVDFKSVRTSYIENILYDHYKTPTLEDVITRLFNFDYLNLCFVENYISLNNFFIPNSTTKHQKHKSILDVAFVKHTNNKVYGSYKMHQMLPLGKLNSSYPDATQYTAPFIDKVEVRQPENQHKIHAHLKLLNNAVFFGLTTLYTYDHIYNNVMLKLLTILKLRGRNIEHSLTEYDEIMDMKHKQPSSSFALILTHQQIPTGNTKTIAQQQILNITRMVKEKKRLDFIINQFFNNYDLVIDLLMNPGEKLIPEYLSEYEKYKLKINIIIDQNIRNCVTELYQQYKNHRDNGLEVFDIVYQSIVFEEMIDQLKTYEQHTQEDLSILEAMHHPENKPTTIHVNLQNYEDLNNSIFDMLYFDWMYNYEHAFKFQKNKQIETELPIDDKVSVFSTGFLYEKNRN